MTPAEGEQRSWLIGAVQNSLHVAAAVLDTPFVDFKWPVEKYEEALKALEEYRADGKFTDEEIGDVFERLAENQQKLVSWALLAVAGTLKSRLIDFVVDVDKFEEVFDILKKIRADLFLEDEELAEFCRVLADALDRL